MADRPEKISFHYLKSNHFRVVHVDGAYGGVTPRGYVHMALYSERPAIPKKLVYGTKQDGTLGDQIKDERESRDGIVREVEVEALFDIDIARALREWLDKKIQFYESVSESALNEGGRDDD